MVVEPDILNINIVELFLNLINGHIERIEENYALTMDGAQS